MLSSGRPWAADLLYVWFHDLSEADWFGGSDALDQMLHRRFSASLRQFGETPIDAFLADRGTALAAILLFDQIPRNLHRDSAQAFAWDGKARTIAREFVRRDWQRDLGSAQRQFVGMPFMHSEQIGDQNAGMRYFAAERLWSTWRFARAHRKMIARFGRFPHRNDMLGRESTDAEKRAIAAGFSW